MNPQDTNKNSAPVQNPSSNTGGSSHSAMAILSYLGILIIIPFLTDSKNDPFVKFHLRQGLVLIISEFITMAVAMVPIIGWIIAPLLWIMNIILTVIGIINAVKGREKELPIIGKYAKNFNF